MLSRSSWDSEACHHDHYRQKRRPTELVATQKQFATHVCTPLNSHPQDGRICPQLKRSYTACGRSAQGYLQARAEVPRIRECKEVEYVVQYKRRKSLRRCAFGARWYHRDIFELYEKYMYMLSYSRPCSSATSRYVLCLPYPFLRYFPISQSTSRVLYSGSMESILTVAHPKEATPRRSAGTRPSRGSSNSFSTASSLDQRLFVAVVHLVAARWDARSRVMARHRALLSLSAFA